MNKKGKTEVLKEIFKIHNYYRISTHKVIHF